MPRFSLILICGWFVLPSTKVAAKPEEQAVIVHAPLSDAKFGSKEDFAHYCLIEDKLRDVIDKAKFGEYDGNEVGGGEFVFYMYANDADRLFSLIEPILRGDQMTSKGYAIVRLGSPGAKSRKIDLHK